MLIVWRFGIAQMLLVSTCLEQETSSFSFHSFTTLHCQINNIIQQWVDLHENNLFLINISYFCYYLLIRRIVNFVFVDRIIIWLHSVYLNHSPNYLFITIDIWSLRLQFKSICAPLLSFDLSWAWMDRSSSNVYPCHVPSQFYLFDLFYCIPIASSCL